jgi:hypothetical protein
MVAVSATGMEMVRIPAIPLKSCFFDASHSDFAAHAVAA